MKILKLHNTKITPAVARLWTNKAGDKTYYQIFHGSKTSGLWCYSIGLDIREFPINKDQPIITLDNNDYVMRQLTIKGVTLKDASNNIRYILTKDYNSDYHGNDILLFWEIPNKRYTDIEYEVSGDVTVIGEGSAGIERGGVIYKSPLPVLEIYGDCSFSWVGKDTNNNVVSQNGKYDYSNNEWEVNPIVKNLI